MKSSTTAKDTRHHLPYLKCKYTYDKALCVHCVHNGENPQSFKWSKKRDVDVFVLRVFFRCLFVGYSWLERISICLPGASKLAPISASCWTKAQLNPCASLMFIPCENNYSKVFFLILIIRARKGRSVSLYVTGAFRDWLPRSPRVSGEDGSG